MEGLNITRLLIFIGGLLTVFSCRTEKDQHVVLHRSNCQVCHTPLDDKGQLTGLKDAHPWQAIDCVDCHGGNPQICDGTLTGSGDQLACDGQWIYDKERAHVSPGDGPAFIKNLSTAKLDSLDPAYIQFINPGDLRVAQKACGSCHQEAVDQVPRSIMSHTAGEISIARYRAGREKDPIEYFGALTVESLAREPKTVWQFAPPPIDEGKIAAGMSEAEWVRQAQDQYLVKSCFRCHLSDFGENTFRGDHRSSGCSACHVEYNNDGLSESSDPTISKDTSPHPKSHQMVSAPSIETCTHCHYRGARIGISYQGYRESAGSGYNPPNPATLGETLHGHDFTFYLTDEDTTNQVDETPPDVHFTAGMLCVDCHGIQDVHGEGHLPTAIGPTVKARCEDCHGDHKNIADPNTHKNLTKKGDDFYLKLKKDGKELLVPQVKDSVTKGHPRYTDAAHESMGANPHGFSHIDEIECSTCHSAWIPSCYGCHVSMDFTKASAYQTTSELTAGKPSAKRSWIALFDSVLMKNSRDKISLSMPAERFTMSVTIPDVTQTGQAKTLFENRPRTFVNQNGEAKLGFGQRPVDPHTTQKRSTFMACDRCHAVGSAEAPKNKVLLDITHGFGSQRFPFKSCDATSTKPCAETEKIYQLDAIINEQGEPLVVSQPQPKATRPLTLEEISRMRKIVVPGTTEIPENAATDPFWPK